MYCDIVPTLVDLAGGTISDRIDAVSFSGVLLNGDASTSRKHALMFGQRHLTQRAIRKKDFKLIWTPDTTTAYHQKNIMGPESKKRFHDAWLEKAKTDPAAKAKVDRIIHHPEFQLYDMREGPFETNNLASAPTHSQCMREMFSELKRGLAGLNDELGHE
jgi:arylsulfatase A-like enzyme